MQTTNNTRGTRSVSAQLVTVKTRPKYGRVMGNLTKLRHARNVFARLGAGVRVEGVKRIGGRDVLVGKRIAQIPNDPTIEPIEVPEAHVAGTFEPAAFFYDEKAFEPKPVRRIDTGRLLPRVVRGMNRGVPLFV